MPGREIPYDPDVLADIMPAHVDEPTDQSRLDRIMEAVEALPDNERAVVEYIIWGRMSKADTAVALGFHRSYVHKLWRKAKLSLGEVLDELL